MLTGPSQLKVPSEVLTDAESAVMELMRLGRSNAEIACLRGTSLRTVAIQVTAVFRKLGVGSRRELNLLQ